MSQSILNDLLSQLQGGASGQIAQQLGADAQTTQQAISAALPMIVGALGRNTQSQSGADALFNALQRDHSGSNATDLMGMLAACSAAVQRAMPMRPQAASALWVTC